MPTLPDNLKHLLKHGTTTIDRADVVKIADLRYTKAVFLWEADGKVLLKLTEAKGAARRVRAFIRAQRPQIYKKPKKKIYRP